MTTRSYPASLSQRLLWQAAFRSAAGATSTPRQYWIRNLDAAVLQRVLDELRARHETLRTRMVGSGSRLTQEVSEPDPLVVEWLDEAATPDAPVTRQPGQEVLARVRRHDASSGLLLLDVDHLLTDAWSCDLLSSELAQLYAARRSGRDAALPKVRWQYRDFTEWQLGRLSGEVLERLQTAWLDRLAGAEPVQLPRPARRVPRRERTALIQGFQAGRAAAEQLSALGSAAGTTASVAAVALFFLCLGLISEQEDLTIGSIFANRSNMRSWRTVGLFAHLVPLRLRVTAGHTVSRLLREAHEMMAHALANQELPMSLLPAGSLHRDTAVGVNSVVINLWPPQQTTAAAATDGGSDVDPAHVEMPSGARFDLELGLRPSSHELDGFVRYATDRFSAEWVERFRLSFVDLIRRASAAPEITVRQLRRSLPSWS